MISALLHICDTVSQRDADTLLAQAGLLRQAARSGVTQAWLCGKTMGLLSEAPHGPGAELFRSAVEGLGARCTHIQPSHLALATPLEIQRTARILGRLYDALECQGMASTLVQKLRVDSGVPVYDGVACPAHATAPLAGLLDTDVHASINRCLVLQAVLLSTLV